MSDDSIQFGTDGWRARIGEGYTFANLRRVAAAAAVVEKSKKEKKKRRKKVKKKKRIR